MSQQQQVAGQSVAVPHPDALQPHPHHGRTLAAWVGSLGSAAGFTIAAVGFLMDISWPVVWVGFGIVAVAAIAGLLLRNLGHGQKGR